MGKLGKLVLVVAQGAALRAKMARLLQPAGYAVELAADERRALDLAVHEDIDAAILVIGSGLADLSLARRLSDRVPRLIVLAERSTDIARLDRSLPGADVHLSQPLDEQKLLGRLAELMASPGEDPAALAPAALRIEGCRINLPGRTFVHADGREVALTRAESALLIAFVRNPGRVLSRDQLSQAIAGHGEELYGRGIDMHVGRLRRKIEPGPKAPRFIITVSGAGYKFAAGPQTVEENRESPTIEPGEQMEAAPERTRGPRINLPPSESERRQLTVLSCELVDSMAPTIDADPEDVAGVVHRFQDACAGAITNMGGNVAGFTGQEVLALFGYPKAYEDDAERAVHAGLDLAAKMEELVWPSGKPLQVRIGIATGLVVVTDQAVIGEPSTVAPRLRSIAPADSILVAATTRKLLGRAFICDDLSSYELAGISEKVTPAWSREGAPSRTGSALREGRDLRSLSAGSMNCSSY